MRTVSLTAPCALAIALVGQSALAQPAPADAACIIRGTVDRAVRLRVSPPGSPPFELQATELVAAVTPRVDGTTRFCATAPLVFDADVLSSDDGSVLPVAVRLRRRTRLPYGVLTVPAEATALAARPAPDGRVSADFWLGGSVRALNVPLACDAFAPGVARGVAGGGTPTRGTLWEPTSGSILTLCSAPNACGPSTVEFSVDALLFQRTATQGDAGLFVWRAADHGAEIRTWIPLEHMRPWHGVALAETSARGGERAAEERVRSETPPGVIVREATLRAGAPVYASPGAGPWATAADGAEVTVRFVEGEPWAQVISAGTLLEYAPGGSCDDRLCHAWVARADVTVQES